MSAAEKEGGFTPENQVDRSPEALKGRYEDAQNLAKEALQELGGDKEVVKEKVESILQYLDPTQGDEDREARRAVEEAIAKLDIDNDRVKDDLEALDKYLGEMIDKVQ